MRDFKVWCEVAFCTTLLVLIGTILLAGILPGQVIFVSPQRAPQPTLAPACKCEKCDCDPCKCKPAPLISVVKKTTPAEASVIVRATKGKEVFQCSGTAVCDHTVLTCAHVLRPGFSLAVNGKPATLLRSDAKSDVALLTTEESLPFVNVSSEPLGVLDACTAYGYEFNKAGKLWYFPSRVTAVNRYQGFPNVSISGKPLSGRSGGGLFNSAGEIVGVCSAADGSEGLYCGLEAIQKLMSTNPNPSKSTGLEASYPEFPDSSAFIAIPNGNKSQPIIQNCPGGACQKSSLIPNGNACPNGQCPLIKKNTPGAPLAKANVHKGPVSKQAPQSQKLPIVENRGAVSLVAVGSCSSCAGHVRYSPRVFRRWR